MTNPGNVSPRNIEGMGDTETELYNLRNELNNVILALRQLTAKLDADGGITDTDYAEDITEDTGTTPPSKVIPVS